MSDLLRQYLVDPICVIVREYMCACIYSLPEITFFDHGCHIEVYGIEAECKIQTPDILRELQTGIVNIYSLHHKVYTAVLQDGRVIIWGGDMQGWRHLFDVHSDFHSTLKHNEHYHKDIPPFAGSIDNKLFVWGIDTNDEPFFSISETKENIVKICGTRNVIVDSPYDNDEDTYKYHILTSNGSLYTYIGNDGPGQIKTYFDFGILDMHYYSGRIVLVLLNGDIIDERLCCTMAEQQYFDRSHYIAPNYEECPGCTLCTYVPGTPMNDLPFDTKQTPHRIKTYPYSNNNMLIVASDKTRLLNEYGIQRHLEFDGKKRVLPKKFKCNIYKIYTNNIGIMMHHSKKPDIILSSHVYKEGTDGKTNIHGDPWFYTELLTTQNKCNKIYACDNSFLLAFEDNKFDFLSLSDNIAIKTLGATGDMKIIPTTRVIYFDEDDDYESGNRPMTHCEFSLGLRIINVYTSRDIYIIQLMNGDIVVCGDARMVSRFSTPT